MTTTINYPESMPMPLQDGYSVQHASPLLRSQMVSGRARQRRIFTSVPSFANVTFFFEYESQIQFFEVFFRYKLNDGAEWFNCRIKTPMGTKLYECRFVDIYGPLSLDNEYWQTSAQLEIIERETLSADWAEVPELLIGSDIIDLAINREWPSA